MKKIQNKKVKNATKVEIDGICFRSKLEAYTYLKLKEVNIFAEYEQHRFELLPTFHFEGKRVRAMTYLPDFVGDTFIIECKGFSTDTWPIRKKLFEYYLSTHNIDKKFYIVRTQKEVNELIKNLKENGKFH